MTRGSWSTIVWLVAVVILAPMHEATARGGRGGRGGSRGGFSSRGPARSGSLGQRGHGTRGGFDGRGPAASGSFEGSERREARQDAREIRRDERQTQGEERREQARENWQEYADDHYDDPYYGSGYYQDDDYELAGTAAAVAAGAAIGAAAVTPPYWTLSCMPTEVVAGTTTYYRCGTTWYIQVYSGDEIAYTIVNPPAGY
jgi:hypothetical protein